MIFLLSASCLLPAGDEAPVKRRPRILIYDQEANLVPAVRPEENDDLSANELDRRIRSEAGAPASLENPVSSVSRIPLLNTSGQKAQAEKTDEDEDSRINPMDFLLEEDRLDQQDLEINTGKINETEQEMEITGWEELQKSMIMDALVKEDPDLTDEELTEMLKTRDENPKDGQAKQTSGGLEMEEIAPLQEMNAPSAEWVGAGSPAALRDSGGFVPVLQSARRVDGEMKRSARDPNVNMKLPGSSAMLNTLKEKWTKPSESSAPGVPGGVGPSALPRESLMNRPLPQTGGLAGFAAGNPAVRPLSEKLPLTREVPRADVSPPSPRQGINMLRRDDYRIRSQVGQPPGL